MYGRIDGRKDEGRAIMKDNGIQKYMTKFRSPVMRQQCH
jgi:hypothetical protein